MRSVDEVVRSIAAVLGVRDVRDDDRSFRERHGGDLSTVHAREGEAVGRMLSLRRKLKLPS